MKTFLPILISLLVATQQLVAAIGSSYNPSPTLRGINRDIYIAVRTDGRPGTGTADDPFDGSTAVKFDTRFREATTDSAVIHLGPGTFRTGGSTNLADDIFAANKSFVVVGAGIGVTTLKLQTNAASGTATNVYLLRSSGGSGNVTYFELGHMDLSVDAANQALITGAGEADVGAVSVFCERGYLHDLNVVGVYGNPAEKFPVGLATRSIGAVAVNGHHVIERVKVVPTASAASDDMTCINIGDPAWDSVAGQISGAITDCVVLGSGTQVAMGGFNLNGVLVQGNYVTNCLWGWVTDSYTNRNVTIMGNRFAYVTTGASFTGNAVSNGRFIFNTLENPVGGATVFGGTSSWDAVFGNAIESGYALNLGETAVLAGIADTNYFTLFGGTNFSLLGNLTNWSKLATNVVTGGGAGTFEATQFGTGGGKTNILDGATTTNLILRGNAAATTWPTVAGSLSLLSSTSTNQWFVGPSAIDESFYVSLNGVTPLPLAIGPLASDTFTINRRLTVASNTILTGVEMRGVVTNAAGSTAAPSVTFTNDTDTGFFSGGDGIVTLSINNANKLEFRDTYIGSAVVYRAADGSGSAPSLTFGASTDIGIFYAGTASQMGIAAGGAEVGRVSTNNFLWGLTAAPASLAKGFALGDGTGATADPASGVASWAYLGSPQYRGTNTTSGGGGNSNWLHNAAAIVVGAGTDDSVAASWAKVDFGTTDPDIVLPTAGTYAIDAAVMWNINSASQLNYDVKLYNATDAADVPGTTRRVVGQTDGFSVLHDQQTMIQTILTVTASKTIEIHAQCGEPMVISSTNTSIRYIRLY